MSDKWSSLGHMDVEIAPAVEAEGRGRGRGRVEAVPRTDVHRRGEKEKRAE